MLTFRRCRTVLGLALFFGCAAWATPPLTIVQDILFNADGSRFNGVATITWASFEASDQSNVPAGSITTQIVGGLLRVQLVPTTNALSPASYSVVYNSSGNTQFTETWGVPSSNVPVRVSTVRIGSAGTTVGTGGSGGGGSGGGGAGAVTTVNISDVIGLSAALALRATVGSGYTPSRAAIIDGTGSLDGAIGNASDCLHVDGSSGPCSSGSGSSGSSSSPTFIDAEVPAGSPNGVNAVFQLGNAPNPTTGLQLFRNGLLQKQGADYSLIGTQVTFTSNALPQTNDVLLASYRTGTAPSGYIFVDAEIPTGTVDGSNTSFALTQAPNPVASLALYRNGLRLRANLDYTVSAAAIVFQPGLAPQPGDVLLCSYRH
jgi:hypothetical protein